MIRLPHPEERAFRARLEGWNDLMVRDGATAPPHHEALRPSILAMPQAAIAAISSEISTL